jgi:hypothetical protein
MAWVMSATEFDIIFRGDIVMGHSLADVKLKLQQLFKTDAAKVDALFTGRPVPLKRNLDEATAQKYRDVLLKAGALVEVVTAGKFAATPAPVKPAPRPASPSPQKALVWTLAPVGTNLVDAVYRPVVTPLQINTNHLSIRPQAGNLVDTSEVKQESIPEVVVPNLDLAALGTNLITAEEKFDLPLMEIELEDWEIAPAGSDLLAVHERPSAPPVKIEVGNYGLAPVGSDLGQLKPEVKPVTPDISQLRMADSAK